MGPPLRPIQTSSRERPPRRPQRFNIHTQCPKPSRAAAPPMHTPARRKPESRRAAPVPAPADGNAARQMVVARPRHVDLRIPAPPRRPGRRAAQPAAQRRRVAIAPTLRSPAPPATPLSCNNGAAPTAAPRANHHPPISKDAHLRRTPKYWPPTLTPSRPRSPIQQSKQNRRAPRLPNQFRNHRHRVGGALNKVHRIASDRTCRIHAPILAQHSPRHFIQG